MRRPVGFARAGDTRQLLAMQRKLIKRGLTLAILAVSLAGTVSAQQSGPNNEKVIADKIIAQVGDNIVLQSDVREGVNQYRSNPEFTNLPPDLECHILKTQVMMKALAIQAQRDSLPFSEEEVNDEFQRRINHWLQQFGGDKGRLEQAVGKTIDQIRQEWAPDLKQTLLAQKMQRSIAENVTITPVEVEAYYNQIPKDSLKFYESQFEASQIVMYPKPNQDIIDYIKNELEDWKKQVEDKKANFQALAKLYSDEPHADQTGGQMSINRQEDKGRFDPDFMNAAFRLRDGQISPVIKTQFGYHIIEMVSRAGNDAIVRHIVKVPPVTDEEVKIVQKKMDSIKDLLSTGKMDFSEAFNRYNEDKQAKFNAGAIYGVENYSMVTTFTIDQLIDKELVTLLPSMKVGEFSDPQTFTDQSGKQAVRIVYLRVRTEPHRENLKDDYDKIAQRALVLKQQEALDDWLTNHMKDFYVQIDPSFSGCPELAQWMQNTNEKVEHYSSVELKTP